MEKLILIKYGELTTKKDNRGFFIKTLENNIIDNLYDIDYKIKKDYARMFIYTKEIEKTINRLKKIFGIHEIVEAYKLDSLDIETIKKESLNLLKKESFKTFKIETKRSNKSFPIKSMDVSRNVGGFILKNISNINVDVHNPEVLLNIEIRNEATFIYYKEYSGLKGYPVGVAGKGLLMLSGGIDSPVAGYLCMKRGIKLDYLYFDSPPHTSIEAKNKVMKLAKKLNEYNNIGKLYIVNFTKCQESILKNIPHHYLITIMRRMMYKISEELSNKYNYLAVINGENISQVASQTLTSMKAINEIVKIPIIRPLATYDKLEIIDLAKKIDTYETSILPYEDCCTIFVPKHPVINPNINNVKEYEQLIPFDELIKECILNVEVLKLEEIKEEYL